MERSGEEAKTKSDRIEVMNEKLRAVDGFS